MIAYMQSAQFAIACPPVARVISQKRL